MKTLLLRFGFHNETGWLIGKAGWCYKILSHPSFGCLTRRISTRRTSVWCVLQVLGYVDELKDASMRVDRSEFLLNVLLASDAGASVYTRLRSRWRWTFQAYDVKMMRLTTCLTIF